MLGYDEDIKLGSNNGELMGIVLGGTDVITFGYDVVTELLYLYISFDGSTDGNLGGVFLGDSLVSTDDNKFGTNERIKLGLFDDEVLVTLLGNIVRITLGIDVGIELGSINVSFDGFL